jgi:hypothetical protein
MQEDVSLLDNCSIMALAIDCETPLPLSAMPATKSVSFWVSWKNVSVGAVEGLVKLEQPDVVLMVGQLAAL